MRVREGSLAHRLLTVTLVKTTDRTRAERSRLCWTKTGGRTTPVVYRLRPIGILHALFGFTVDLYPGGHP